MNSERKIKNAMALLDDIARILRTDKKIMESKIWLINVDFHHGKAKCSYYQCSLSGAIDLLANDNNIAYDDDGKRCDLKNVSRVTLSVM